MLARVQIGQRLQGKVDASDLVQETFLDAHRNFAGFRGGSEAELIAWLRTILAAKLADLMRRYFATQGRDVRLEREIQDALDQSSVLLDRALAAPHSSPSQQAVRREQGVLLADALDQLPEAYREVLVLRHLEGLPFPEVARRMGAQPGQRRKTLAAAAWPSCARSWESPHESNARPTRRRNRGRPASCQGPCARIRRGTGGRPAPAARRVRAPTFPDLAGASQGRTWTPLTWFMAAAAPATAPLVRQSAAVEHPILPGRTARRFPVLCGEIGRGGMGVVYEAVQLSLGRRVALKVLPFAAALDARQLQRFKNEAQAAAQLHHTNIVPVYAVGCDRATHYYAMQLIEGQNLADLIGELRSTEKGGSAERTEADQGAKSDRPTSRSRS